MRTRCSASLAAKQTELHEAITFDANGLSQELTEPSETNKIVWDTAEPLPIMLEDENGAGEEVISYVYGPENLPVEEIFGLNAHYLHHDQQGSTRALTYWEEGEPINWTTYGPYGNIIETDPTSSILEYDGQLTDPATGLVWLGARRYDSGTGQFMSIDPAPQSGEPYAYTSDNPENHADPSGEATEGLCVSGGGAIPGVEGTVEVCLVHKTTGALEKSVTVTAGGAAGLNALSLKYIAANVLKLGELVSWSVMVGKQTSNANSVGGLAGWFTYRMLSLGFGLCGARETFQGGGVQGETRWVGFSPGFGWSITYGVSYTWPPWACPSCP